jgi:hypothetical protein
VNRACCPFLRWILMGLRLLVVEKLDRRDRRILDLGVRSVFAARAQNGGGLRLGPQPELMAAELSKNGGTRVRTTDTIAEPNASP